MVQGGNRCLAFDIQVTTLGRPILETKGPLTGRNLFPNVWGTVRTQKLALYARAGNILGPHSGGANVIVEDENRYSPIRPTGHPSDPRYEK